MHEMHDEVANVVVCDNMDDLEANLFDALLEEFMVCMKCQVLKVLQRFFSFLHGFDKKRAHNMLALMMDLKFKSMHMVGQKHGKVNNW
jgi:hypothetical protein